MKASVIICTYNRAHCLLPSLQSVARAIVFADTVAVEIVVVDNASTDDTAAVLRDFAASTAIPVRAVYEPKKGLSAARNRGIGAARGELLVFTDDDCRMDRDYIVNALRHDADDSAPVMRGGAVRLGDPADLPLTITHSPVATLWARKQHSAKYTNIGDSVYGCNMVMRKSLVERLGVFDVRLGAGTNIPGGDDTDFVFRAYCANIAIHFTPDLVVEHHHGRKSIADGYNLMRNYMIGSGALYIKYAFVDIDLCRPFAWDVKNLIRECVSGRNEYMLYIGFSYRHKVIYSLLGAAKYLNSLMKGEGAN